MFITVYGKYGPQPPKNHVINTNLNRKFKLTNLCSEKKNIMTSGYKPTDTAPNMFTGYQDRRQRSFATQLG